MTTRVLFFDIDGTLIDTAGAGQQAMLSALQLRCGSRATTEGTRFAGRTDRGLADELFAKHDLPHTPDTWQAFHDDYVRYLHQHLPQRPARMLPGVPELVEHLHTHGNVHLALLTGNTPQAAACKLSHFDLWRYFGCGGFGDRHVNRNDVARDAVRNAEEYFGIPMDRQEVWVIGDTPQDIECAHAVQAKCLAVATGRYSVDELAQHRPEALLPSLLDFDALVALWP